MLIDRFKLDGQVAVVTGGGRGIGRGIGVALAEQGASVVLAARTQDQLDEAAAAVEQAGGRALTVICDVTSRTDLEALVAKTREEFGRLDILVNNAGGGPYRPALETSEKVFEETLRFTLTSAFLLTRLASRMMLAQGAGVVLNITSALDHQVERGFVAYGTAKAGMKHMTELLGYELAPKIRVNGISVGSVETSALAPFLEMGQNRRLMAEALPMRRIGTVEDVGLMAMYLCSSASSWVTGKVFEVDGGAIGSNFPIQTPDV